MEELPPEALVVRMGSLESRTFWISVIDEHEASGRWGLSVLSRPSMAADEMIEESGLPHSKYRVSTVGAIRDAGYDVIPDEEAVRCHALLLFVDEPADIDYERVTSLFSEPRLRPHGS
ncbi:MAG: hypothetical protein DYH08_06335 [Actinobacteria bacterium ATB1]|nr:hypothetical protein [Actinobacteria bacterium ATB1]